MRILVCASDTPLPPTNTGYRRQLQGLLPELRKRNDVSFIGYRMPDQEPPLQDQPGTRIISYQRPGAAGNVADIALAFLQQRPLRAHRFAAGLRQALHDELRDFKPDVIHVGPGKLAGLLPDLAGRPSVLGVMDTWHLNVEARATTAGGLRAALLRSDVSRIRRFEANRYRGWDRVVPSNEDDLETLRSLDPTLPLALIPIGFDASAYAPDPHAVRDPNRIIFHGAMAYAPNIVAAEFLARQVLPRVRAVRPQAHLAIVGRDPAPRVEALGSLPGVTVTGGVDDMRSWLTGSQVWAGPFLSGTGIKTKLLEAMATDLPCVVTPLGGRGLDLSSGSFMVGSTEEELATLLVKVLEDDEHARSLGRAGGDYVRSRYDWPVVGRAFERLYEDVIAEKAVRAAG
ncbi:MAG: glycosyltransferase family 4 protein [Candidatus Limnocylindria bacterium]